jgi:dehydrogenase/reductase SDR family member 12
MVCPMLNAAIDDALEISVVGSFSRIGPLVRSRLFAWADPAPEALAGCTVAITGPTSGLGLATARAMAGLGARVILVGRREGPLQALAASLAAASGADRYPVVVADMASLRSVRAAVASILATEPRLDVLVDNAGAIHATRQETEDGIEATLGLMVVGPFTLEAGLLPLLEATPGSRVIAVTSGGMYTQRLPLDDLEYRSGEYAGAKAYARAKRAQVALVREWSRRIRGRVAFSAMHPGWADTPGLADSLPGFYRVMHPLLRSPEQGIDTILWLASHPQPARIDGRLFLDRRSRPFDRIPSTRLTPADRRRLWDLVVALGGGADPAQAR